MGITSLAEVKAKLSALLSKSRASIRAGRGISHAEFWKTTVQQPPASGGERRARSVRPKAKSGAR